jgi:uncharacterized protein (UPF0276 family)
MANRFGLPDLGVGLGLRTVHYADIVTRIERGDARAHVAGAQPEIDWFEILSENYMQTAGRPLDYLDAVAARYPVAMHGVSLSIGGADPLDRAYLTELRALRDRTGARWVSDHLCWTGVAGKNTHDLLPMPYTEEALAHVVGRVKEVQDFLGAPLALENPSTYVEFVGAAMPEWEFLARLAEEADCALLLDVNNVFVSARNHGYDTQAYLAAVPFDRVVQMHVAGHTDHGTHIIDSHIGPVKGDVWRLLGDAWRRAGGVSVLLEWDAEIPSLAEVHAEAMRAHQFLEGPEDKPGEGGRE